MKVFVGYDTREDIAYQVCKHSILNKQPKADVRPLKQQELRDAGWYTRSIDKLASTEFTFTRFLIPELANFKGWALFMDCDMILTTDIKELFDICNDPYYPLWCVHHKYEPKATIKMDNQLQEPYRRKNWSSLMMFNCAHPLNKPLTVEAVNTKSGRWLHGFEWLPDKEVDIGKIPEEWNWLDGHSPVKPKPKNVHFTTGGPWFPNWNPSRSEDSPYIIEWHNDREWINITGGKHVEDE